jgi:PAS domain S-box-containing protein
MQTKPAPQAKTNKSRGRAKAELQEFRDEQQHSPTMTRLYRRAETKLRKQQKNRGAKAAVPIPEVDSKRLLHELQVHQVELEMQNVELQEARDRMEVLLEKYTDLYDFAPVGYLSLDEQGRILEVNLTAASLLHVGRSQLIKKSVPAYVAPANRAVFLSFLQRVFAEPGKQICEAALVRQDGSSFWADFHGICAMSTNSPHKWCRVVISDITVLKRAEEAQRRLAALAVSNEELRHEIVRRQMVEDSLKKSEQHQSELLVQSRYMEDQLRQLSRQILSAQEEERKEISRELHDVIAQTLTGINIRLATLKKEAGLDIKGFDRNITRTQKLVEESVNIVHRFARELRPAVLDDLGLIPALLAFMKNFTARTGVRTHLTAFAQVEQLETAKRTVLFRVAQEALTNVARHAKASRVEVDIQKQPRRICMTIKDDGKSFSVDRTLQVNGTKRLGLLGMRERLEMVGGDFAIESSPGKGTSITAGIPTGKTVLGGARITPTKLNQPDLKSL